jgi:hypothetical protein
VAKGRACGRIVLVAASIEVVVGMIPDQELTAAVLGGIHWTCHLHLAYFPVGDIRLALASADASHPAYPTVAKSLFACGPETYSDVVWMKSWSATDPAEGQHQKCSRRRLPVENSKHVHTHWAARHLTYLADSLPCCLRIMRSIVLCWTVSVGLEKSNQDSKAYGANPGL